MMFFLLGALAFEGMSVASKFTTPRARTWASMVVYWIMLVLTGWALK